MEILVSHGSLQWTSLVPLWARHLENKKENSFYKDELASKIVDQIEYDFADVANRIDLIKQLTIVIRSINFEKIITNFIEEHPNATIVDLGAGFDTLFYRIDNGSIKWYDIDFPEILNVKKHFIPINPRYGFIDKSVLDFLWIEDINNKNDGILLIAGSLFKYFEETNIKLLFKQIGIKLPGTELAFDCGTKPLLRQWKRYNKETNLDPSHLKFSLAGPEILESWNLNIRVLDHYAMFSQISREEFWPEEVRKQMDFIDKTGVYKMYRIRIN